MFAYVRLSQNIKDLKDGESQVESIGDCYMISAGCPLMTERNVARAAETALDMISAMSTVRTPRVVPSGYGHCVAPYGIAYCRKRVPGLSTRYELSHVDRMQSSPFCTPPPTPPPPSALP